MSSNLSGGGKKEDAVVEAKPKYDTALFYSIILFFLLHTALNFLFQFQTNNSVDDRITLLVWH